LRELVFRRQIADLESARVILDTAILRGAHPTG
jgi:hypothetical protein